MSNLMGLNFQTQNSKFPMQDIKFNFYHTGSIHQQWNAVIIKAIPASMVDPKNSLPTGMSIVRTGRAFEITNKRMGLLKRI